MHNIKLSIAYDGTGYLGWQKTRMGPSIQEELERVLSRIFQQPISVEGASRTDAGVHAEGQVASFSIDRKEIDLARLEVSLNQLLPPEIAVLGVEEAPLDFHPSLHALSKIYRYRLFTGKTQLPQERLYTWHDRYPLELSSMRKAASSLLGERDFSAFCNTKKGELKKDAVRKLFRLSIREEGSHLLFELEGNRFLYKMARNLVGTLIYVGRGRLSPEEMPTILASRDRKRAGITAPACGLSLYRVLY